MLLLACCLSCLSSKLLWQYKYSALETAAGLLVSLCIGNLLNNHKLYYINQNTPIIISEWRQKTTTQLNFYSQYTKQNEKCNIKCVWTGTKVVKLKLRNWNKGIQFKCTIQSIVCEASYYQVINSCQVIIPLIRSLDYSVIQSSSHWVIQSFDHSSSFM